ncbi:MAG: hypothetical protein JNN30_14160 [Rhodanobacteraceae bacterium]|nr:hypothetical protein [Rhodanobacteraceae bacterium]
MTETSITAATRRRSRLALTLLSLASATAFAATAVEPGTAPAPMEASVEPPQTLGGMDEIDAISRKQALKPQKLRCWQEGKLIVEREVDPASAEVYRSVELADPQKQPMRLYDLRNATCLIQ